LKPEAISAAALASLLEQVARRIHSQGYASDLFPAQWAAIRYLAAAPPQLRTAIDLARFQGLASGAVARTVRTLISKGLLVKLGTIGRGRAEQLELTALGRRILADDPLQSVAHALEILPAKDREALANGLEIAIRATMPIVPDGDDAQAEAAVEA
jgi:DNA-binding MarR family transcriptional regulator